MKNPAYSLKGEQLVISYIYISVYDFMIMQGRFFFGLYFYPVFPFMVGTSSLAHMFLLKIMKVVITAFSISLPYWYQEKRSTIISYIK